MKHSWIALLLASPALAQKVDGDSRRPDTLRVFVSGGIDFDGIYRDRNLTGAGAGGRGFGSSTWSVEGEVGLRFDIEMQEKINAVVSLRTQRVKDGFSGAGDVLSAQNGAVLLSSDHNAFGADPEETRLFVDEASVTVNELFDPLIRLTAGIVPVAFDLRGRGSAFFFDPRHSSTFGKGVGLPFAPSLGGGAASGVTVLGFADELQPAGFQIAYARESFTAGLFLLPAILEGGDSSIDEAAYGIWALFAPKELGEGTRFGVIVAVDSFELSNTSVWTVGGGLDFHGLLDGLEIYGEVYFQFGRAGVNSDGDVLSAGGWAFQVGAEYRFPDNARNLWFGIDFTWVSGDGDREDDSVQTFLSYENVNDLLILEDRCFGLDLDTNYLSLKLAGGMAFTLGSGAIQNNLEILVRGGLNLLHHELTLAGGDDSRRIGHEIDLRAKLSVTKQMSFDTAVGFLLGSEVLEEVFGTDGENGILWTLGTTVRF